MAALSDFAARLLLGRSETLPIGSIKYDEGNCRHRLLDQVAVTRLDMNP